MPHLQKVYEQVKSKGVQVLAVCVWDQRPEYDKWVIAKKGTYTFPTVFDPAGRGDDSIAGKLYGVSGIPTQYVIDKNGNVAAVNVGYETGDTKLEEALGKLGIEVKAP
jgi:peroxiredoxin